MPHGLSGGGSVRSRSGTRYVLGLLLGQYTLEAEQPWDHVVGVDIQYPSEFRSQEEEQTGLNPKDDQRGRQGCEEGHQADAPIVLGGARVGAVVRHDGRLIWIGSWTCKR
jgi:hypothetical protein